MSTNRVDLVSGIATMMAAFIVAQPTLLKRHFSNRPTSVLTDWPCSFLDLRPTTVHYDSGLRDMSFTPSLVFVDAELDPTATTNRLDEIVDAFTDHLDSYAHIVAGTSWSDGSWSEEAVPLGSDTYAAGVRWTWGPITFLNGRN